MLVIDPHAGRSDEMAVRSMLAMAVTCNVCHYERVVTVTEAGYQRWKRGASVVKALPGLAPEVQRALVLGRCPQCEEPVWVGDAEVDGE